ncbi:leucine-rich repeat protein [Faecalibacterium prausnitzii]|uniref:leucine-rich repeat protein n=1 Tax=Faecalibacterium prausnitzii TaxID=853 RepID=UPI0012DC6BFE|nr:leucine-rich repeat protein [Faecalibacterium prausnitzii]
MKKRLISLLVAACMIFALLPVSAITAFAEESVLTGYCGADNSYESQTYYCSTQYNGAAQTFTGTYYSNAIWTLTPNGADTYKLTISGTGQMGDFGTSWSFGKPWNYALAEKESTAVTESRNKITEIEIAAGITAIGAHAFEGYEKISKIELPDSVTELGEYAFNHCSGVTSVRLSNNLTEIKATALSDLGTTSNVVGSVANPISITLPDSLLYIRGKAFSLSNGSGLKGDLTIPDNVQSIGEDAFVNNYGLTGNLTIGKSVKEIGRGAFSSCKFTGKLSVPGSVTKIGEKAFMSNKFTSIQIANGVTSIGEYAFSGCTSVHSIDLSSIAQATYGDNAFASMSTKLIYVDNLTQKSTVESTQGFTSSVFAITNGGTFAENATFEEGKLAIPEKTDYTFKGWYENAEFDGNAVTTAETGKTYYAKWEKNKYTVTLNNNGHGEQPAAMPPVEYGDSVADLPELRDSANEWVFDGWYMDENFTTKYDNQAITDNTTLYAKWHEYQNTSLTAKVSKSDYLVNTPADVNVTVTPGDDFSKLMQDKDNIKISLTYDDDVTSVMLNDKVLDQQEYTISELMQLMGQNRELKLNVTYGKAGTHTFGIALKNGNEIVSECSTDIVVAEEAAELTPATKLYTLTVKNADVTIKNGDEEIKAEKNDKGELIAKVPEKADVTVTYTSQSDAVAFDQWTITTDETLDVDVKNNPLKFQMPAGGVTIEAMTKDASIEESEPNILGTAAVVGTAAVGTAILAWQGYQLGTELYLKTALPAGTAIPTNRAELALLVWNHAGKPAPAAVLPADATDTQKAIAWAVENDLLKAAKDNGETYVDTDSVSRVEVIRVWNKAQEK